MPRKLATLWVGDRLSEIEQLSARSFLDTGHDLTIFAYGPLEGVPEGAKVAQARDIYDTPILRYKNGSPAIHANLFRYAMIEKTDLTWVDLDLVARRPFDFEDEHIFGLEAPGRVNNAVLRLPKTSPALARLRAFAPETRGIQPNAGPLKRAWINITSMGKGRPINRWDWGATGPTALTQFLKETDEINHARPASVFYPVPWEQPERFLTEDGFREADIPEACYAVHLWGFHIRRALKQRGGKFHQASYLARSIAALQPREISQRSPD